MPWSEVVPSVVVAAAVLFWPAPFLLASLRLPPLASVALSPAVAVLVLTASAVVADAVGAAWGWPWVLGVAVLLVAALAAGRWWVRRGKREPAPGRPSPAIALTYLAGIVVAGAAATPALLHALVGPLAFSQRFDNVLHLNAIRLAAEGQASPLDLEPLTYSSFYPAAWHEWAGLVVHFTGADVRTATQACILVVVLLLWPITLGLLVETVVEPGVAGRLALGPLALSSVAFPLTLAAWGPLYANFLGVALTPALIAVGWDALGRRATPLLGRGSAITLTAIAGLAVAVAHPNAALSAGLILFPVALAALWSLVRRGDLRAVRDSRAWTLVVVGAVVLLPAVWWYLGRAIAAATIREPFTTPKEALVEAVVGTSLGRPPVPALTIGLILGLLVAAFVPRLRPLLASFALTGLTYFAAAGLETGPAMLVLTAPYYTDPYRIAAAGALVVVPLAVLGWDHLASLLGEGRGAPTRLVLAGVLAVALLVGTLGAEGPRLLREQVRKDFSTPPDARVLTPDELALIERLPRTTEAGAMLVVNPFQGGPLAYAFAGRPVTDPYMYTEPSPAARYLAEHLREAADDPQVCAAVRETGARYALVLEPYEIPAPPGTASNHDGLRGLDTTPGFEVVDREGAAALYRISACA